MPHFRTSQPTALDAHKTRKRHYLTFDLPMLCSFCSQDEDQSSSSDESVSGPSSPVDGGTNHVAQSDDSDSADEGSGKEGSGSDGSSDAEQDGKDGSSSSDNSGSEDENSGSSRSGSPSGSGSSRSRSASEHSEK